MMAKRGPKPLAPDWEEFDKLCAIQCTLEEIAAWYDCDEATIERCVKKNKHMKFADYFKKKAGKGKISLRRAQWQQALKGDKFMLRLLGENHLGQSRHIQVMLSKIPDDVIVAETQRRLALEFDATGKSPAVRELEDESASEVQLGDIPLQGTTRSSP